MACTQQKIDKVGEKRFLSTNGKL